MKRILLPLGGLVVVAAVATLGVGWVASNRIINQDILQRAEPAYQWETYPFSIEEVEFVTDDGVTISAWWVPGARRETVIAVHGFRYDRSIMLPNIQVLHDAGYSVLAPTLRGAAPIGRRTFTTLGFKERLDVRAAVRYAETRPEVDPQRIAVLGISMGAATAIMTAAQEPHLVAVVAEAPFKNVPSMVGQTFEHFIGLPAFPFAPVAIKISEIRAGVDTSQIDPFDDAALLGGRPLLVIHGIEDDVIPYTNGVDVFHHASAVKELWLVDNAQHANAVERAPAAYTDLVTRFLDDAFAAHVPDAGATSAANR